MCSKATVNPVNGRAYTVLDKTPYWAINERIENELAAQDDNRRLYNRLPSPRENFRLLALYLEALAFWQNLNPTDYCMSTRAAHIDYYRSYYRRKIGELADDMGLKLEMQVVVEQLPMISQSLRQQMGMLV